MFQGCCDVDASSLLFAFLTAQNNNYDIALAFQHSDVVFFLLINVKMPTIVCILTFVSRIHFLKVLNIDVWLLRLFSSRVYVWLL